MLSLQDILDIACRHATAMAHAMVDACLACSLETGEPITMPRGCRPRPVAAHVRPTEDVRWRRLVEGNSDTRGCHV